MNPTGIDPQAPVIARHSLLVEAPVERLWWLHIGVDGWPTWQHSIDRAHLDGDFSPGSMFTWTTFGLDITSTIYEVEPMRHTLWGGRSGGITGIPLWTFTAQPGDVLVATEESWSGAPVENAVAELQSALDD